MNEKQPPTLSEQIAISMDVAAHDAKVEVLKEVLKMARSDWFDSVKNDMDEDGYIAPDMDWDIEKDYFVHNAVKKILKRLKENDEQA